VHCVVFHMAYCPVIRLHEHQHSLCISNSHDLLCWVLPKSGIDLSLSKLCGMQYGVFFFFAGCVVLNTLFAFTCLPETKGVPVEKVEQAWDG